MKKYLFIIVIITILLLAGLLIWIYPTSQNELNNKISQNNSENISENINEIIAESTSIEIEVSEIEDEDFQEETIASTSIDIKDSGSSSEKSSSTTVTTSSSSKTTEINKSESATSKSTNNLSSNKSSSSKDTSSSTITSNSTTSSDSSNNSTINNKNNPKEDKDANINRCTKEDNHGIEVGNTGKWFNTKNEAIAYYKSQIEYWGTWWENTDLDDTEADATYYKNCPTGYNVFSCMYCNNWTINFYYR